MHGQTLTSGILTAVIDGLHWPVCHSL